MILLSQARNGMIVRRREVVAEKQRLQMNLGSIEWVGRDTLSIPVARCSAQIDLHLDNKTPCTLILTSASLLLGNAAVAGTKID